MRQQPLDASSYPSADFLWMAPAWTHDAAAGGWSRTVHAIHAFGRRTAAIHRRNEQGASKKIAAEEDEAS